MVRQIEYLWAQGTPPSDKLQPLLKKANQDLPHVRGLIILNSNGYLIADSLKKHKELFYLGDRDYFAAHSKSDKMGFFIGKPTRGRVTGEWLVSGSYRFNKISGKFGGVVMAVIDPFYYREFFDRIAAAQNIQVAIIQKNGILFTHSSEFFEDEDIAFGKNVIDFKALPSFENKVFSDAVFPFTKPSIKSLVAVPGYNFYVLTKHDEILLSEKWNEQLAGLFIIFLVTIIAAYLSFITISKREYSEKEAIKRQNDSENRFKLLAENARDIISLHALNGVFLYVSPSCKSLVGFTQGELVGKMSYEFIEENDQNKIAKKFTNILETKEIKSFRYQVRSKCGELHWLESSAKLIKNPEDSHDAIVVISRNIDETVHFENELKKANKKIQRALLEAQSANMAKSKFLGTMSHELRTPLNAIIGFSDMIIRSEYGKINDKYKEYATYIHKSGDNLLQIIIDILNLSKIDMGKFDLEPKPIYVNKVIENCCQLMSASAYEAEIMMNNQVDQNCPKIIADEQAIKQIITNLISNSIKYSKEEGHINIIYNRNKNGDLEISITDNGIGIPKKHLKTVLEPFTQVESHRSKQQQGIGLGLPLVKALMEIHEGRLILNSEENVGTTVILIFPNKMIIQ